jgi:hypothetical protein
VLVVVSPLPVQLERLLLQLRRREVADARRHLFLENANPQEMLKVGYDLQRFCFRQKVLGDAFDFFARNFLWIVFGDSKARFEDLHKNAVRGLTVGKARAFEHGCPFIDEVSFEFARQTRFADAGVAGDEHDAPAPIGCQIVYHAAHAREFFLAADHRRAQTGDAADAPGDRARRQGFKDFDRLDPILDADRTEFAKFKERLGWFVHGAVWLTVIVTVVSGLGYVYLVYARNLLSTK